MRSIDVSKHIHMWLLLCLNKIRLYDKVVVYVFTLSPVGVDARKSTSEAKVFFFDIVVNELNL